MSRTLHFMIESKLHQIFIIIDSNSNRTGIIIIHSTELFIINVRQ